MLLPIKWITEHFNCSKTYDILSCKFEMTGEFRGPIFYIQALKTWETLVNTQPQDIYELYSTSIWFNKVLGTQINNGLVSKGFTHIKDLFPENSLIRQEQMQNLTGIEKLNLFGLRNKLPQNWIALVNTEEVIIPQRQALFRNKSQWQDLFQAKNKDIYTALITNWI